jgi:carbamoylphosphate synthase small subunit
MWHAYLLFALFGCFSTFVAYSSTTGSTCGSLFDVAAEAVATAVVLRVMTGYWISSDNPKFAECQVMYMTHPRSWNYNTARPLHNKYWSPYAAGMRHAYLLFDLFGSFSAFDGYSSTAWSSSGFLFGVAAEAVGTAVVFRVMTGYWMVSNNPKCAECQVMYTTHPRSWNYNTARPPAKK